MLDPIFGAESVENMHSVGFLEVRKLAAVVRLNNLRRIPKKRDCALYEIDSRVPALLLVRVDETLARSLLDDSVLIKFFIVISRITGGWNVFYIKLPLLADFSWCIILARMTAFLFG